MLKFVGRYFISGVSKKGLFWSQNWGQKKIVKIRFQLFFDKKKRKKNPMPIKGVTPQWAGPLDYIYA